MTSKKVPSWALPTMLVSYVNPKRTNFSFDIIDYCPYENNQLNFEVIISPRRGIKLKVPPLHTVFPERGVSFSECVPWVYFKNCSQGPY